MILDTDFLVKLIHQDQGAVTCAQELELSANPLRCSALTIAELQMGVARAQESLAEYQRVVEVVKTKEIVPMTEAIAARAGRLEGELRNRGEPIGLNDCIVAATALHHEEPVVTRNVDHFDRIDGLLLREY